jgi:hypothetical protein
MSRVQAARQIQLLRDIWAELEAAGLAVPQILREGYSDALWSWDHPGTIPPTTMRVLLHYNANRRLPQLPRQRQPQRARVVA